MPRIPVLGVALLAAALVAPHATAADPFLDGKKRKALHFTQALSGPQQHLLAETVDNPVDTSPESTGTCAKPRCYAVPFAVKPAKGVSDHTALSVSITWTLPTTRLWLIVMDVTKKTPTVRGECFSFYTTAGTSAVVRLNSVKPDRKYAVWVTVQQLVAPDSVEGTVTFPAQDTVPANPGPSPTELFVNGCNT
jgi:hypothetical protein